LIAPVVNAKEQRVNTLASSSPRTRVLVKKRTVGIGHCLQIENTLRRYLGVHNQQYDELITGQRLAHPAANSLSILLSHTGEHIYPPDKTN